MTVLCTMWTTLYCTGFSLCLSRSHLNGFSSSIHSVCSDHCIKRSVSYVFKRYLNLYNKFKLLCANIDLNKISGLVITYFMTMYD